jgi:RNA polymerase sigma factor (sigma-70 family)
LARGPAAHTTLVPRVPLTAPDQAHWFATEVLPHGPAVEAWLRSRFPAQVDAEDILQDAYVRVLQARQHTTIVTPRAFLFATARNLALGRLRHRRAIGEEGLAEVDPLCVLDQTADVPETVARTQELTLLTQAIQSLPTRCRQILTLRKLYGLSQKEVAARLGISEHTVEAQGTIALRKLTEWFERVERKGVP